MKTDNIIKQLKKGKPDMIFGKGIYKMKDVMILRKRKGNEKELQIAINVLCDNGYLICLEDLFSVKLKRKKNKNGK